MRKRKPIKRSRSFWTRRRASDARGLITSGKPPNFRSTRARSSGIIPNGSFCSQPPCKRRRWKICTITTAISTRRSGRNGAATSPLRTRRACTSARAMRICLPYASGTPPTDGLVVLPAGRYLCADCTEESLSETLRALKERAAKDAAPPAFTLRFIVISGIARWRYRLEVPYLPQ